MKRLNTLLLIVSVLIFSTVFQSCKDSSNPSPNNAEVLPLLTHEGKNTMGCLINGEVWLPKGDAFRVEGTPAIDCYYYPSIPKVNSKYWRNMDLRFYRTPPPGFASGTGISLHHVNIPDTGKYRDWGLFEQGDSIPGRSNIWSIGGVYGGYYVSVPSDSNWLHVTYLDTANRIISGQFQFDLVNERDSTDILRIREGRFDVTFLY